MPSSPPLALLGYGRFGQALCELALAAGVPVRALDPTEEVPVRLRATDLAELIGDASVVVLAVPYRAFRAAVTDLRPLCTASHTIVDVASVKSGAVEVMAELLGAEIPWVATHPLFGPTSIAAGERPLRSVVCPDTPHASAVRTARALYERLGCEVIEQPSDEHDALMAHTHALAFFVAKGLLEIDADGGEAAVPPSFRAMAATIESVRSDAGHLFFPIQHDNPHAPEARERLLDALSRIHRELAETGQGQPVAGPARALAIPPPAEPDPKLGEERERIDRLDREIVELLARRARLAHRVARVKAEGGHAVQDPGREDALLQRRREFALDQDLDPEAVEDVFEAILRFSRKEMRMWMESRER
jgi:prephenate dehydrogenase